ncbi:MAG: hypothetical protein JSS99_08180 [Actinobacteria bacterium]|nr:hypothetical protein [Actinomycetota bacterium]
MGVFVAVMWAGAIGTGCLYWFKYSTTADNYILRRYKTGFAMVFWPVFLAYVFLARDSRKATQASAEDAKRRILGD